MNSQSAYASPGVYREASFPKPEPKLATGVAGLAGFARRKEKPARPLSPNEPIALHHRDDFGLYFETDANGYLAEAVTGFFRNGGERCYVAYTDRTEDSKEAKKALQSAVCSLASLHDVDVLAVPDAVCLKDEAIGLQAWILKHCAEQGDCFAILDVMGDNSGALSHRDSLLNNAEPRSTARYGALYYPWLKVRTSSANDRSVPPCGHVAGIYARGDARVGVFKAPANEEVLGAFDLETEVTNTQQEQFNPKSINCLRSFPGRGIRVWGARTLSEDPAWRYINVRRLFITVRRWINANMGWAVFEPNVPRLWMRVERDLRAYLHGLWQLGALQGRTPEQAFFVKCDAETNPRDGSAKAVVTEIGLAPVAPAEFVIVRIVHRTPAVDVAAE